MKLDIKKLVGSGDKIGLFTLPFIFIGLVFNIANPSFFGVGGPPYILKWVSIGILIVGIINWIWSVVLIITKVTQNKLITNGPYSIVRHPLYTGVAFLVIPWVGFLCNTWLGVFIGIALYVGSRLYSPYEEKFLSKTFGTKWDLYNKKVRIPWL
jgi:protein-S-isoprenylcysteine O-methyltransferase Ste14